MPKHALPTSGKTWRTLTTGTALAGLGAGAFLAFTGPASAAPADNGVDLAPLCSVLTPDTLAQLRASGVVPAEALERIPADLDDDQLLTLAARLKLGCGSGAVVTGDEANTVLCDQVLNVAYIHNVVGSSQLDLPADVAGQVNANVSEDNVGQARDLFGCDTVTPNTGDASGDASLPAGATEDTPTESTAPGAVPVDPSDEADVDAQTGPDGVADTADDPTAAPSDDAAPADSDTGAATGDDDTVPDTSAGVDTGGW